MKRWFWVVTLLLVVAVALPAYADTRLKVTGFIDNHIRYMQNLSSNEEDTDPDVPGLTADLNGDVSQDDDEQFNGRTRGRIFFHIAPNDFSKGVFGFEFDQEWGQDNAGGPADPAGGFDLGNDNNAFELKWLYVDVKIPDTPARFQVGGFSVNGTRLKRCVVFCDDAGGVALHLDFNPQVKLYSWYIIAEEELIETGADAVGEDFTVGFSLRTTFVKGLDVDFFFAFYGIENPSSDSSSLIIGSCSGGREGAGSGSPHCFDRDERYYAGFDARWRHGNFTFSPTFIFLFGKRELVAGGDADIEAFLADIRAAYTTGPFTVTGRFVYIPGNDADDDLGDGDDLNFWQNITVTTVNRTVQWFELLGWNFDSTSAPMFGFNNSRAMRSAGTFDQFGLVHGAVKGDYKLAKPLTATIAVGFFATEEDTGAPARFGGATVPRSYNWTGDDTHLGTEIDAWLTYQWFKGTTVNAWFAYAIMGDAMDLCEEGTGPSTSTSCDKQEAEDKYGAGIRMIYRF